MRGRSFLSALLFLLLVRSDTTIMPSRRLSSLLRFDFKSRHQPDHIASSRSVVVSTLCVSLRGRKARHLIHRGFFKHPRESPKLFPPSQHGSKDLVPQAEVEQPEPGEEADGQGWGGGPAEGEVVDPDGVVGKGGVGVEVGVGG